MCVLQLMMRDSAQCQWQSAQRAFLQCVRTRTVQWRGRMLLMYLVHEHGFGREPLESKATTRMQDTKTDHGMSSAFFLQLHSLFLEVWLVG